MDGKSGRFKLYGGSDTEAMLVPLLWLDPKGERPPVAHSDTSKVVRVAIDRTAQVIEAGSLRQRPIESDDFVHRISGGSASAGGGMLDGGAGGSGRADSVVVSASEPLRGEVSPSSMTWID